MTYDFQGVWDKPETPSKRVVPLLNAHRNLTEIKGAMDVLWRNGISPDNFTEAMAFLRAGLCRQQPSPNVSVVTLMMYKHTPPSPPAPPRALDITYGTPLDK